MTQPAGVKYFVPEPPPALAPLPADPVIYVRGGERLWAYPIAAWPNMRDPEHPLLRLQLLESADAVDAHERIARDPRRVHSADPRVKEQLRQDLELLSEHVYSPVAYSVVPVDDTWHLPSDDLQALPPAELSPEQMAAALQTHGYRVTPPGLGDETAPPKTIRRKEK